MLQSRVNAVNTMSYIDYLGGAILRCKHICAAEKLSSYDNNCLFLFVLFLWLITYSKTLSLVASLILLEVYPIC